MRYLMTADLHLDDNPINHYRHAFVRKLPAIAKKVGAESIIIAGDLTTEKDRHSSWLTNTVADHLSNLSKVAPLIIYRGNHDYTVATQPFFQFVRHFGVTWINEPAVLDECLFLPHTNDYQRDWKDFYFSGYRYIFAHNTFAGAIGNNGFALGGVPLSLFPRDCTLLSGDVHTPQHVDPCLDYVGAPYTINFGDEFEPRVFILDDGKVESFAVGGVQKRLLEFDDVDDRLNVSGLQHGDILKVRLKMNASEYAFWPERKRMLKAWADEQGYVLHLVVPVVEQCLRKAVSPVAPVQTDEQLLKAYAKLYGLDENTLRMGENLLRRV